MLEIKFICSNINKISASPSNDYDSEMEEERCTKKEEEKLKERLNEIR